VKRQSVLCEPHGRLFDGWQIKEQVITANLALHDIMAAMWHVKRA